MHIVHFCGALKGGPLSAIADWTRQQVAAGHKLSLIYSPMRDPAETFRADLAPEIELFPLTVPRDIHLVSDLKAMRSLTALLRRIRPDVIHLHSSKAGAIGRVAARFAGVPSVYSTHGLAYLRTDVGVPTRALFFALEWLLGAVGNVVVACSPSELHSMRAIPGRKIAIPNGIDLPSLNKTVAASSQTGPQIALCGRITAQKNPQLACRIARLSPASWRWIWLGDGDLQEMVTREGRIAVKGWMPRAEALAQLGASDIMVHTSSWEGMPIAILEAMAMGLPVVATNVVGNRDLVQSGITGYVADDETGFLKALNSLAESDKLRRQMGEAGRQRIMAEFDQAKLGVRWQQLYDELTRAPT